MACVTIRSEAGTLYESAGSRKRICCAFMAEGVVEAVLADLCDVLDDDRHLDTIYRRTATADRD